jgi:catechol 2,3-dioxygenase-like lactoylglutathione lyase family enzyme
MITIDEARHADAEAETEAFVIKGLDHVSLTTTAPVMEALRDFYRDVLGMETGLRPAMGVPGYWLYADSKPIVHLNLEIPGQPLDTSPTTGPIHHVSFRGAGLKAMMRRLDARGIPFEIVSVQGGDISQMFLHDPSGIRVEILFMEPRV